MLRQFIGANRRWAKAMAAKWPGVFGAPNPSYLQSIKHRIDHIIDTESPDSVLEAGGVDRPMIARSDRFTFIGVDIDERPDCSVLYDEFIVQSIEDPLQKEVGMVLSFTLMEHVPNNTKAVKSMFESLKPGGTTHHYIPSKHHPYSLALRAVGPMLQKKLIPHLRPGAEDVTGYPTFFDHCTPGQMERLFKKQGFTDVEVRPYYRANDYFAFFLPLYVAVSLFENLCKAVGLRAFASGFTLHARKPATLAS